MKNKIILGVILGIVVFSGGVLAGLLSAEKNVGGSSQSSIIATLTQNVFTASSTPTLISQNDKQGYRVIANSGSNTAYLFFNSTSTGITSSTATKGVPLFASSKYEITSNNYLTGQIWVVLSSGTTTVSVGE